MKTNIKNRLVTLFAIVLSVCMLVSVSFMVKTTGFAQTNIATQVAGASVRVNDTASSGIKFKGSLDKTQFNALYVANGGQVRAGMMIVPSDYIEKAGGHTFNDFANANLKVGSKTMEEYKLSEDEQSLEFTVSLINLKDVNYTRDFESIVYIESDVQIDGFAEYNGKYYAYASRDAENARNIFEVASKAYNDVGSPEYEALGETGLAIAKSYMDGVADVKFNQTTGKFEIANNTENYTSPFVLTTDANGHTMISGGTVKSMMYNGVSTNVFNIEETTGAKLHAIKMEGATVDENGVITTTGREIGNSGQLFGLIPNAKNATSPIPDLGKATSYYAFDGKYGVGTAIDIYFTGNNMPEVMFFADKVNGNMTGYSEYVHQSPYKGTMSGEKGVLISNGFYAGTNTADAYLTIWGPNRMYRDGALNGTLAYVRTSALANYTDNGKTHDVDMIQSNLLKNFSNVNFKYTVSTYKTLDNLLRIKCDLYNADTLTLINSYYNEFDILSEIEPGAIVLYDTVKGDDTVFSCSAPYAVTEEDITVSSGASITSDGTVTLTGRGLNGSGQPFALVTNNSNYTSEKPASYLGLVGEYGVGTYIDFEFTGNNMPEVMFFADVIDDQLTGYGNWVSPTSTVNGRKGVLVSNGIYSPTKANDINHAFTVWGPNRIFFGEGAGLSGAFTGFLKYANISITDGSLLTQETLEKTEYENTNFKYTVGTFAIENELGIHAILYTVEDGVETVAQEIKQSTGIALSEVTAGNIIIYDTIKGKGTTTVFKYGKPYKSAPELSKGAIVAEDGTITLTGTTVATPVRMYNVANIDGNYYAPSGLYGVGTYVDLTFTGNNMPEVMMFSDTVSKNITGFASYTYPGSNDWTQYVKSNHQGLVFSNGFGAYRSDGNGNTFRYSIWGMDRVYSTESLSGGFRGTVSGAGTGCLYYSTATQHAMSQDALENADQTINYKYTVGTYEDANGYMVVEAKLVKVIDENTTEDVGAVTKTTTYLAKDIKAGSIVFYDSVKGTGTTTVFKIDKIYQKAN